MIALAMSTLECGVFTADHSMACFQARTTQFLVSDRTLSLIITEGASGRDVVTSTAERTVTWLAFLCFITADAGFAELFGN